MQMTRQKDYDNQKQDNNRNCNRNRNRQQQFPQRSQQQGSNDDNKSSNPAYNAIFGDLAYCCKAAINGRIRRVNGVWVKECGATHHMHHDKTIFTEYHKLKHRLYVREIGSELLAAGVGKVSIMDNAGHVRILENVLHVPKLKN